MRKRLTTAVAALMLVGPAGAAAAADNGDGLRACNFKEICFARDLPGTSYQKQFWGAAAHTDIGPYFMNMTTGVYNGGLLHDNADQLLNWDSACDVRVVDDRGPLLPDDFQDVANTGRWVDLFSSVDNENDRHERVSCI